MPQELLFCTDFDTDLPAYLAGKTYSRLLVLIDENVNELHAERLDSLPEYASFVLPSGEEHKTLATVRDVWDFFLQQEADRDALCVILGGGLAMDMGGYACAAWKRGIRFVLVPTSLLGMVDASVGGKVGVNFEGAKNLIGDFVLPEASLFFPQFLNTLPEDQLRSGLAEILKHALIADEALWNDITSKPLIDQNWPELVRASVAIKQRIVDQDPEEKGLRKVLNFGHTVGHVLESASLNTGYELLHGEAIAWGMVVEARLSKAFAGLSEREVVMIERGIRRYEYTESVPPYDEKRFRFFLLHDKKTQNGKLKMSLLPAIGQCRHDVEVPIQNVLEATKKLINEFE